MLSQCSDLGCALELSSPDSRANDLVGKPGINQTHSKRGYTI